MLSIDSLESPTPAPTAGPFVLLVDDHAPSLRQLQDVVTLFGHPCVSAGSASDALVYCDARSPRVVVTDLSMPDLDGQGLARWLKARYPTLPIILVTGEELDAPTLACAPTDVRGGLEEARGCGVVPLGARTADGRIGGSRRRAEVPLTPPPAWP